MKVYNNHAYIVAEAGSHGMQVFDLTRLRNVANPPQTFTADARDTSFGSAHNIALNEDSGYAFVIGSNTCSGGPRMFNLASPKNPAFAGCVSGDGYTHDTQGVIYHGPDADYRGKEILFSSNEDTVTIVDITTKSNPVQLARKGYAGSGYTHQGWLTEDHRYFLLGDETDETSNGHNTRTYVWDVSSLTNPVLLGHYTGTTAAIDHNLYVKGNYVYEANYKAGLQIIDLTNITSPASMTQAAFFDVHPESNSASYAGAWSNYPYFASGVVIVNSIERGLFVVKPNLGPPGNDFSISMSPSSGSTDPGSSLNASVNTAVVSGNAETIGLSASGAPSGVTVSFNPSSVNAGGSSTVTFATTASAVPGTYPITITGTAASATRSTSFMLTINGTGGGCTGTNGDNVQIPDNTTVESAITITGCAGNVGATSTVEVHLVHTYIGDLIVNLVAPDGSTYLLHNRGGGSADDINQTYTVNLSGEAADGTWKLRVQDAATYDTGYIDTWTVDLGGGPPSDIIWSDDFESATGWTTDPDGTDTATNGTWERGDPEATSYGGTTLQLATATSGANDLVTGRLAGSGAGSYDVDGGMTSSRSPAIALPAGATLTMSYSWYLAHLDNASSADYFRISIIHSGGTTVLFTQTGSGTARSGSWATDSHDLSAYAGGSVRILVECADASGGSLVECGVDDIAVISQ